MVVTRVSSRRTYSIRVGENEKNDLLSGFFYTRACAEFIKVQHIFEQRSYGSGQFHSEPVNGRLHRYAVALRRDSPQVFLFGEFIYRQAGRNFLPGDGRCLGSGTVWVCGLSQSGRKEQRNRDKKSGK